MSQTGNPKLREVKKSALDQRVRKQKLQDLNPGQPDFKVYVPLPG